MVNNPQLPPAPRFDQSKDGNPFFWIIQQANEIRERRLQESRQRTRPQIDYLTGKVKP